MDHVCEQPNRMTGQNCGANSHNARGARNAEPARREARSKLPATREVQLSQRHFHAPL